MSDQPTRALSVAPIWRVEHFDEIDSTNRWLAEQSAAGVDGGLVAIARSQSAGRGRLGRTWVAPPDTALLMSVLIRPEMPVEQWHLLGFHMALAAIDAIESVGGAVVSLKWPNDLQMVRSDGEERKLAGILAQANHGLHPGVVIGIGVNLLMPAELPADVAARGVWLNELGVESSPQVLARAILNQLALRFVEPVADVVNEVRRRCVTIGRKVRVELSSGDVHGTAVGLADDGALIVETDSGVQSFHAGDVIHLR
jgi:BirA family transcriptional regulator, biotin operon repressor / biotin---[acetyl-CoA-carboxylase] ligase